MSLENLLRDSQSPENTDEIVTWVGNSASRFASLMHFYIKADNRTAGRAAWMISELAVSRPKLVQSGMADIMEQLQHRKDESVRRNTLRILLNCAPDSEEHEGVLMNICFDIIAFYQELPGTKANALTVLDNLTKRYPEIRQELITIIKERFDEESPAFKSRAKKILTGKKSG